MPYLKIDSYDIYYEVRGDLSSEKTIAFFNPVASPISTWDFFSEFFQKQDIKLFFMILKARVLLLSRILNTLLSMMQKMQKNFLTVSG